MTGATYAFTQVLWVIRLFCQYSDYSNTVDTIKRIPIVENSLVRQTRCWLIFYDRDVWDSFQKTTTFYKIERCFKQHYDITYDQNIFSSVALLRWTYMYVMYVHRRRATPEIYFGLLSFGHKLLQLSMRLFFTIIKTTTVNFDS